MSIPQFTKYPSTLSPLTFAPDMDAFIGEMPIFITALNAVGTAFGLSVSAFSTTSLTIGLGIKSFTVQADKGFVPGMELVVASTAAPTTRMIGTVFTYNSLTGAIQVDVSGVNGSGTYAAWSVSMTSAVDADNVVTPTGTQTLTNKTLTDPVVNAAGGVVILPTAANPAQTAGGSAAWDSDNEVLTVGTGTGRKTLMNADDATVARLASPTFTGNPAAPTPAANDSSASIATTEFVSLSQAAGKAKFTAAGDLAAGQVVALNGDGTIGGISYTSGELVLGDEQAQYSSATSWYDAIDVKGSNKVILVSDKGIAVGSVDAVSKRMSVGPAAALPAAYGMVSVAWHPVAGKAVITYLSGSTAYAMLATISGSTIIFSDPVNCGTAYATGKMASAYNADQNRVIAVYGTTSSNLCAQAIYVSGDSITAGTALVLSGTTNSGSGFPAIADIPGTPNCLVVFPYTTTYATVVAANGSVLSKGSNTSLATVAMINTQVFLVRDAVTGKFAFFATGNNKYNVLSVSGVTVTAGSYTAIPGIYASSEVTRLFACYDGRSNTVNVLGCADTDYYAKCFAFTVSGTTLVAGAITTINNATSNYFAACYDSTTECLALAFRDSGDLDYGHTRVMQYGEVESTAGDWIGITAQAILSGAQGWIYTEGGICTSVSGLTMGSTYYVDNAGNLQPTGTNKIGKAIAANKIVLSRSSVSPESLLPAQENYAGRVLTTDGNTASWAEPTSGRVLLESGDDLPAGCVVVLNDDGTISMVGASQDPPVLSAKDTFFSSAYICHKTFSIPNTNKIVMFTDSYIFLGGIEADGSITNISNASFGYSSTCCVTWHPIQNLLIIGYVAGAQMYLQSATITPTTITLNTAQIVTSSYSNYYSAIAYNADQNRILTVCPVSADVFGVRPVQVTGPSTFVAGTADTFPSSTGGGILTPVVTEIPGTPNCLVVYPMGSASTSAVVVSINANTVTKGSYVSVAYVPALRAAALIRDQISGKFVYAMITSGTKAMAYSVIGVSGMAVTFPTPVAIPNSSAVATDYDNLSAIYNPAAQNIVIMTSANGTDYAQYMECTISGSILSFDTPVTVCNSTSDGYACTYNEVAGVAAFIFRDGGNSNYITTRTLKYGAITTNVDKWIGITGEAISLGSQGWVYLEGGVCPALSGLDVEAVYYVDDYGTLQTAGARKIGRAIAANKLLVMRDDSLIDPLPSRTNQGGKYLFNDGTGYSWQKPLPEMAGNSGKYLFTDGADASWVDPIPSRAGQSGNILTNDGTNTSWAAPTAGLAKFTASGDIATGDVVVLNGDGTISTVGSTSNPGAMGAEQAQVASVTYYNQALPIPGTDKVVVMYTGFVAVGTVDPVAGTVTMGTPVAYAYSSSSRMAWHIGDNKLILSYVSTNIYIQVGTVTGTTLSLGTANSGGAAVGSSYDHHSTCYNAHQNKIIVSYTASATSIYIRSASVASGVVTWNTALSALSGTACMCCGIAEIPGTPYMLATYYDTANKSRAAVVEANGVTMLIGTAIVLSASLYYLSSVVYDQANSRFVCFGSGSCFIVSTSVRVATLIGSGPVAVTGFNQISWACYDSAKGKVLVCGTDGSNYGIAAHCSVSGTTIVLGSLVYFNSSVTNWPVCGYSDYLDRAIFAYQDTGNMSYGTTRVVDTGDIVTNANKWVGIANAAISNAAQGMVTTKGGICSALSGLTAGMTYYIDDYGDLQQTGSRICGVALAANKIMVLGNA